jgi:hypothetical protein
MQNYTLEREVKKQNCLGEVHYGGEGLNGTVVPLKKEEEYINERIIT